MKTITVYREEEGQKRQLCRLEPDSAVLTREIMRKDEVNVRVTIGEKLPVKVGDFIEIERIVKSPESTPQTLTIRYTLNREPRFLKKSAKEYEYDMMFEAPVYRLMDKLYLSPNTRQSKFIMGGTLADFVRYIVDNVNSSEENPEGIDTGWEVGEVVETETRAALVFENVSCWSALAQLANEFNVEYDVVDKKICFYDRFEVETDYAFEQGKGKGLYTIEQNNVDTSNTVTRAYLFGGTKNLPPKRVLNGQEIAAYRNGEERLRIDERYIEVPPENREYDKIVEAAVIFDDIYPSFEGKVEGVSQSNGSYTIVCNGIDFDTEDFLLPETTPVVNFLSGDLEGRDFECTTEAGRHLLKIPAYAGSVIQEEQKEIKVNDRFTITGICMPESYVDKAEIRLREEGEKWFARYNRLRVQYTLSVDSRFLQSQGWTLAPGDLITLRIPELFPQQEDGSDAERELRIISVTLDLLTGSVGCTVSNYIRESWQQKIEGQLRDNKTAVTLGNTELPEASKTWIARNFARLNGDNIFSGSQLSSDYRPGGFGGAGWGIFRKKDETVDKSVLEVDDLIVRREAKFNEVVISQVAYVGGKQICSMAGIVCTEVEEAETCYRCYFDTKEEKIHNLFQVNDLAYCEHIDPVAPQNMKKYWRCVTAVGDDYIDLSKSDKDEDDTGIPEKGDNIVQLGNKNNPDRQSAIITDVQGGAHISFLDGINNYSLSGKEIIAIGKVGDATKLIVGEETGGRLEYDNRSKTLSITGKIEIEGESWESTKKEIDETAGSIDTIKTNLFEFQKWKEDLNKNTPAFNFAQSVNKIYPQSEIAGGQNIVKNLGVVYSGVTGKDAYFSAKFKMTGGSTAPSGTMRLQLHYRTPEGEDKYIYLETVTLGSELTNDSNQKTFGSAHNVPAGSTDLLLQLRFDDVSGFENGTLQVWDSCCTIGTEEATVPIAPSALDYKTAIEKEEAERRTFEYLKEAIGGKTEANGGLFTCNMLGINAPGEVITGGFASGDLAMWAGGTLQEANEKQAKFIVKKSGEVLQSGNLTIRKNGEIRILNEDPSDNMATVISGKKIATAAMLSAGAGSTTTSTKWNKETKTYTRDNPGTGEWEIKGNSQYNVTGNYIEINPLEVVKPSYEMQCTARVQFEPLGLPFSPAEFDYVSQELEEVPPLTYTYRLNLYKGSILSRSIDLSSVTSGNTVCLLYRRIDVQSGENKADISLLIRYAYPHMRQIYRAYYEGRDYYKYYSMLVDSFKITVPALDKQLLRNAVFKGSELGINGYCLSAGANDYFRVGIDTSLTDGKRMQLNFRGDVSNDSSLPNMLLSGTVYMSGSDSAFWNRAGLLKNITNQAISSVLDGSTAREGYVKITHNANRANIVLVSLYDERNTTDAAYMPLSIMVVQRDANSFTVRTYRGDNNGRSNGKFSFMIIGV